MNPLSRVETRVESYIFFFRYAWTVKSGSILSNPMTFQDRVQFLKSFRPRGYKTWQPTKTFFLFLSGMRVLGKTPNLYSPLSLKFFYSIYTFSRSSTSSSVQIKPSDLTLVAFPWVLPLLWHTASYKAKYLHLTKTKNLTLFDTNASLPPKTRLIGYCACSIEQYLERRPGH